MIPFPDKKYNIIYADPPWTYENKRCVGKRRGSLRIFEAAVANRYETLTIDEIKTLPVPSISESKAVLFLWATVPLLPEALDIMKHWKFKYKTMISWRKILTRGMGYWFRGQMEHLLLGVRGNVKAFRSQRPNFMQVSVAGMRHSEKPHQFRRLVESSTKNTFIIPKRIELFARHKLPEWDAWGLEVPKEEKPLELFCQ